MYRISVSQSGYHKSIGGHRTATAGLITALHTLLDINFITVTIVLQMCALKVTAGARARILKAGGEIMTFDQLALKSPKGQNTVLLQGVFSHCVGSN